MNPLENNDVRTQIKEYLEKKGIMQKWLAAQLSISASHLAAILKCDRPLTDTNLVKINQALKTEFKKNEADISAH